LLALGHTFPRLGWFALLCTFGCAGSGDPNFRDCRIEGSECPEGFLCEANGAGVYLCVQAPDPDVGGSDTQETPDVGADATDDIESDAAEVSAPDTQEDTGNDGSLSDVSDVLEPDTADAGDAVSDVSEPLDVVDIEQAPDLVEPLDTGGAEPDVIDVVEPPPPPPTVELQLSKDILSGVVSIVAKTTSAVPLMGCEFQVDGLQLLTDVIPPYGTVIDTRNWADGPHTLTAQVADQLGQFAEVDREVIFDNSPPVFGELIPGVDETLFFEDGPFRIAAEASDASGIEWVQLRANGLLMSEDFAAPYQTEATYDAIYLTFEDLPKNVFLQFTARDGQGQETVETHECNVHSRLRWEFSTLGEIWGSAAALPNGNLVFGNQNNKVIAVSPSGAQVWSFNANGGIISSPTVDPATGVTYIGANDGTVHAINQNGGSVWAAKPADSPVSGDVAAHGDRLYFASYTGKIFAINKSNGGNAWSYNLPDNTTAGPAVGPDATVYQGCHDGQLYAVKDGSLQWSFPTPEEVWSTPIVGPDGRIYFGSNDGWLYALNSAGIAVWQRELKGEIWGRATLAHDAAVLYAASTFKRVYKIDAVTGALLWERDLNMGLTYSTPVVDIDGTVYVGTTKGLADTAQLVALDGATGVPRFQYAVDDTIHASILVAGNRLYFGSTDRNFYSLWRYGAQLPE
jgi:outer membrane protein assembly factor BamB